MFNGRVDVLIMGGLRQWLSLVYISLISVFRAVQYFGHPPLIAISHWLLLFFFLHVIWRVCGIGGDLAVSFPFPAQHRSIAHPFGGGAAFPFWQFWLNWFIQPFLCSHFSILLANSFFGEGADHFRGIALCNFSLNTFKLLSLWTFW